MARPYHEGNGEATIVIDERATVPQRDALLRILSGEDTEPGATIFNVFASTLVKLHEPIFSKIDFEVDIDGRKARLVVPGVIETRGEPILNPVTGHDHRVRIDMIGGFEYTLAEIGRGWSKTSLPIAYELANSFRSVLRTQSQSEWNCALTVSDACARTWCAHTKFVVRIHVRFGSLADTRARIWDVRFHPQERTCSASGIDVR